MQKKYLSYIKNLTSYLGASLIPMVLGLIVNPWIAKNMSPEDYATSGYYNSFTSLISPIIIFYLIHYYIKEYFQRNEQDRRQLFALIAKGTIWFSGIITIVCFVALFIYLTYSNHSFPIMPYLALMVFALPLTGLLNLQLAKYRMEKNASSFLILSVSNGILNILLTVMFVVWMKWGALGKLLGPLLCNFVVFLFMMFKLRGVLKIPTPFRDFKKVLIFCFPLATSAMLGYFTNGFSSTYLGGIGKTTEYGYYIVGASIASYLTTLTTAVGNTFQPDLYETTIKKQWSRYVKFCIIQVLAYSTIVIVFLILAPYIISILTADRYVASTPFAQIIALSTITSGIFFIINNYSIATNRPHLYLYTSIIGSIIIIFVTPIFVNKWSFYGGAWMSVFSYAILAAINLILIYFIKPKQYENIVDN